MANVSKRNNPEETILIFDGDIRNFEEMALEIISYANLHGFEYKETDPEDEYYFEKLHATAEDAIEFLNENVAEKGRYFFWDIHFFYGSLEDI